MDVALLVALAEPNRLRIVELLGVAPRSVGEIASLLAVRQPQVSKHLQTLERAGLVRMHRLGQRRIYALRRAAFEELAGWASALTDANASDDVLERYRAAIEAEQAALAETGGAPADRTFVLERRLPAPVTDVWRAFTSAQELRLWWAPPHLSVAECTAVPVAGGPLRLVLEEPDGTRHRADGRFLALDPPTVLRFASSPLGPDGVPLFTTVVDARLTVRGDSTVLHLEIAVRDASVAGTAALAGVRIGWEQILDNLTAHLSGGGGPSLIP